MITNDLEKWTVKKLKDPKLAGMYIEEYCKHSRVYGDDEHKELLYGALKNVAAAHGIFITRARD